MRKYHVFLSCKGDVKIEDENIDIFLNQIAPKDCTIECIKHQDIKMSKEDLDDLEESSIYIIDTHKGFDNIAYWELGYAMGKGIEIIGYHDGKNDIHIPNDIKNIINISYDIERFVTKINRAFEKLKPKEYPIPEDWNKQRKPSTKETEATL